MNKKVLVIGGSGDIGLSISKVFSKNYHVISTSRNELDLSKTQNIKFFIESNENKYDHIIFCSANNDPDFFTSMKISDINSSIQVNLLSIIEILHAFLKNNYINPNGSITIISSLYSRFGRFKRLPYSLSKHALSGLVRNLSIECSEMKIRVNSVSPGFIDSKLTRKNLSNSEIEDIKNKIPLGRLGIPEDIANIVFFLASEAAEYINGQDIVADGGFMAGGFMGLD